MSTYSPSPEIIIPDCKLFSGYKPCEPYKVCQGCTEAQPFGTRVLIINLDAIGDVVMTTAQLPAIRRRYPDSTIFWLTRKSAMPVLANNPFIHQVLPWDEDSRLVLQNMEFDLVLNADKNRNSSAFTMQLRAAEKRGFGLNANGAIIPLNRGAEYNFRLGVDDHLKFKVNRRTGQDILAETWELPYEHDRSRIHLTETEQQETEHWRRKLSLQDATLVVGFNTGCSDLYPLKKLQVPQQADLARRLADELPGVKVILLGGREDSERVAEIARFSGGRGIPTPTTLGLRTGIVLENLADVVISGDSLGMHLAIGLGKYLVAWFGISCAAEIDLFDRGVKIIRDLPCAPCWKKVCDLPHGPICVTEFDTGALFDAVARYYEQHIASAPELSRLPAEVLA